MTAKVIGATGFPNFSELHIHTLNDVEVYRQKARQIIWGQSSLPSFTAVYNAPYYDYTFPQPHLTPQLYRMLKSPASVPNGKAVIYHNEHGNNTQSTNDYNAVSSELNALGYDVYEIRMHGVTPNSGPVPGGAGENDDSIFAAFGVFSMRFHLNKILALVNTIASSYTSIAMIGKSGGGEMTSLYPALDPRITKSFPLCGTAPNFIRRHFQGTTPATNYMGDSEQHCGDLFGVVSWLDMYAMAAINGQHQFFNSNDNCCFGGGVEQTAGPGGLTYGQYVNSVVSQLGGEFSVTTVAGTSAHYCLKDTATPTTRMTAVWDDIILPKLAAMP